MRHSWRTKFGAISLKELVIASIVFQKKCPPNKYILVPGTRVGAVLNGFTLFTTVVTAVPLYPADRGSAK